MFHSALICTDFSDGLHRLVNFVPSLVAGGLNKLVFVSTVPITRDVMPRASSERLEHVRDRFSAAMKNVPEGAEVHIEVDWGKPEDHILAMVKRHKADVVILGTPSRSLLNEKVFGSTTVGLCQRVSVPVLIVRPQLVSAYTVEELSLRCRHLFRYLLVPFDGSDTARYIVDRIKQQVGNSPDSSLKQCLLCWVVEVARRNASLQESEMKTAQQALAKVVPELEALGLEAEGKVLTGNAINEILDVAVDYDISAIALSSRSMGKLIELSVPSFTGEVLRRSWHPVVFFPPQR
ncbi:MAG: universal stress protein [Kaiparowitsia implicata GSE-PSE-MK54-09C]|jgi:nucleotide-binding universal stress UspA family protein|nr:universal stress protein [Kaiparowitsia implicata GSE-PSE-MK54-09C]